MGYEVERPIGQPTITSNVLVPFLQALITGLAGGLLVTWGAVMAELVDGWWPLWPGPVGFLFSLTFLVKTGAAESTLWTVERFVGADLDGDEKVGKPEAHLVTIRGPEPKITTPEGKLRGEFVKFVRGCEHDTAMARWEPILGREQYREWRDGLIKLGWAEWVNRDRRQGWRLVRPVDEIIRAVM